MPNTLIEAMLLGLTVISTDCPCGGPAELISHGVNGLLTPVGDIDKMEAALRAVLEDCHGRISWGEKRQSCRSFTGARRYIGAGRIILKGNAFVNIKRMAVRGNGEDYVRDSRILQL